MRKVTLIVAALVATTAFAVPSFAQDSRCEVDRLMDDLMNGDAGNLLNTYMMKASLDYKNYCVGGEQKSIDMSFYKKNNKKIEKVLRKYSCDWADIPKFRQMKIVEDVCFEEGGLDLVPLVPYTKKQCRTEEFSKIVGSYNTAFEKDVENCGAANLEKYRVWNAELDVTLRKANCTWEDIKGLKRIETYSDLGCKEPPKVAVIRPGKGDDPTLEAVDLVTKKPVITKPPEKKPVVVVKSPVKEPGPIIAIDKKPPPPPARSHWLTYTGIGVGVAGIGLLGGGTHFGLQANEAADNAKSAMTQIDVNRFNRDAADNAKNANIMLGVGGAMVAAGVVLVILDFTVGDSPTDPPANKPVSTSLSVGPGSAHFTMRF